MFKRVNIQWTSKTLHKHVERNELDFDFIAQRSSVWDIGRKSLLIHSLITGYPVPAFHFRRCADGRYDAIDGKQRALTISGYMNNEFVLSSDTPAIADENGYYVDITGLHFSELPEWAQDNIKDYSLTIYYYEDMTDEEAIELLFRLNNGKTFTCTEFMRIKAKSLRQFQQIAAHEIIAAATTEAGKRGYKDENIAMQIWTLCFTEHRNFTTKVFRSYMENAIVTDEQIQELNTALDMLNEICSTLDKENKEDKRVLRKILTKTHLVSSAYVCFAATKLCIAKEHTRTVLYRFFNSKETSVDNTYNRSVGGGSAKPDAVRARIAILDSLLTNM